MRFLGSNLNWVASQKQGGSTWAGKGQSWFTWLAAGPPFSGGGSGGASLSTGYRGSQDIELSRDAHFYPGMKVGKAYGDDVLPRGPADGFGDSWGKAAKSTRFFFFFFG